MIYEIRLQGQLGPEWSDWFEGLVITTAENGTTTLTGPVIDQAALHGLLRRIRDLGVPLLAVRCLGHDEKNMRHETEIPGSEEE